MLSEKVNKILEIDDKGLIVEKKGYRTYPHKNIASQIIGFTDTDNKGIEGIENTIKLCLESLDGSF